MKSFLIWTGISIFLVTVAVASIEIAVPANPQVVPVPTLSDVPPVPNNVSPERGHGAGVISEDLKPRYGQPVLNAARDAEIKRKEIEYRAMYGRYNIDSK